MGTFGVIGLFLIFIGFAILVVCGVKAFKDEQKTEKGDCTKKDPNEPIITPKDDTVAEVTNPVEAQAPTQEPVKEPAEQPIATPVETPAEQPVEAPVQAPTETPAETPAETPVETPTETPSEQPAETPAQEPAKSGYHRFTIGVRGGAASLLHSVVRGEWICGGDALLDLQYAH